MAAGFSRSRALEYKLRSPARSAQAGKVRVGRFARTCAKQGGGGIAGRSYRRQGYARSRRRRATVPPRHRHRVRQSQGLSAGGTSQSAK